MQIPVNVSPVAVGRFLRGLRMELGGEHGPLSITDASKKVGCPSVSNYTNIENGKRQITPEKLLEYTTALLDGDKNQALSRILAWSMTLQSGQAETVDGPKLVTR